MPNEQNPRMRFVTFIRSSPPYRAGERARFSSNVAHGYVTTGFAVYSDDIKASEEELESLTDEQAFKLEQLKQEQSLREMEKSKEGDSEDDDDDESDDDDGKDDDGESSKSTPGSKKPKGKRKRAKV